MEDLITYNQEVLIVRDVRLKIFDFDKVDVGTLISRYRCLRTISKSIEYGFRAPSIAYRNKEFTYIRSLMRDCKFMTYAIDVYNLDLVILIHDLKGFLDKENQINFGYKIFNNLCGDKFTISFDTKNGLEYLAIVFPEIQKNSSEQGGYMLGVIGENQQILIYPNTNKGSVRNKYISRYDTDAFLHNKKYANNVEKSLNTNESDMAFIFESLFEIMKINKVLNWGSVYNICLRALNMIPLSYLLWRGINNSSRTPLFLTSDSSNILSKLPIKSYAGIDISFENPYSIEDTIFSTETRNRITNPNMRRFSTNRTDFHIVSTKNYEGLLYRLMINKYFIDISKINNIEDEIDFYTLI